MSGSDAETEESSDAVPYSMCRYSNSRSLPNGSTKVPPTKTRYRKLPITKYLRANSSVYFNKSVAKLTNVFTPNNMTDVEKTSFQLSSESESGSLANTSPTDPSDLELVGMERFIQLNSSSNSDNSRLKSRFDQQTSSDSVKFSCSLGSKSAAALFGRAEGGGLVKSILHSRPQLRKCKSEELISTGSGVSRAKMSSGKFNIRKRSTKKVQRCYSEPSMNSEGLPRKTMILGSFGSGLTSPRGSDHILSPSLSQGTLTSYKSSNMTPLPKESMVKSKETISGKDSPSAMKTITVADARNTNNKYLTGRHGNTLWISLLGPEELDRHFAGRKARIFCGTFNMAGEKPANDKLEEWLLPQVAATVPDVYAVGVQEGQLFQKSWADWEIMLQSVIGPSHVLYQSVWMGVQHLALFVRREIVWFFSVPETDFFSTRVVSSVKTKGAVAIACCLFGTSILFVSSHLAAHETKATLRCQNFTKIVENLRFGHYRCRNKKDVTDSFNAVFWMGDLNFRLNADRDDVVDAVNTIRDLDLVTVHDLNTHYTDVLKNDELSQLMQQNLVFSGFSEAPVRFEPTYKYNIGKDAPTHFNTQRVPSYTDRILFKCDRHSHIDPQAYNSVPVICTSDHKPVFGIFEVSLRPGRDKIQPSGGKFKRNVFIQGLHSKRSSSKSRKSPSSYRKTESLDKTDYGDDAAESGKTKQTSGFCSVQ